MTARCRTPGCKYPLVDGRGTKTECPACYMRRYRNGGVATPPPIASKPLVKVQGHISSKLMRAVKAAAKREGKSVSGVVEEALAKLLEQP